MDIEMTLTLSRRAFTLSTLSVLADIDGDNRVLSTQVADARIEFRSKGVMDEVQTMGWLQRFFLNISPF